jgi:hypothetical protein
MNRFPDAINSAPTKHFTQVPNDVLRTNTLSFKAKGILCTLLSNSRGWVSYKEYLLSISIDGPTAVESGLKELEQQGYLKREEYIDAATKRFRGSVWSYTDTPNQFDDGQLQEILSEWKLEPVTPKSENPQAENPQAENQALSIPSKEYQEKNIKNECGTTNLFVGMKRTVPPKEEPKPPSAEERTASYLPIADQLADILYKHKQISTTLAWRRNWAYHIRLLHEIDRINPQRIKKVLSEYGELMDFDPFMPVIESGESLRKKFVRLVSAIDRNKSKEDGPGGGNGNGVRKPSQSRHENVSKERLEAYARRKTIICSD